METASIRDQQLIMRLEELRQETDAQIEALQTASDRAANLLATGNENPVAIVNLIDGSDYDWSTDRFLNNPVLGGDIDFQAYLWFRQLTSATLLVEDAAHALKFAGHSLYAANEGADGDIPRWDRASGWPEIGAVGANQYDIACPLPENFIQPGRGNIYGQFQATRRTANALPAGLRVYAGFWDNTVGQQKWIEGGNTTLNAVRVGAAGAISRQFKVIGRTDYGAEVESNVVTIPDSVTPLSTTNYVRLVLEGAAGFIQFDIYELVGGVCSRIGQVFNSINLSYNHYDIAPKANVGAAFPVVTLTKPRAYAEVSDFTVTNAGWILFDFTIPIPSTYDTNPTTGKQWFRWGLTLPTADPRQVLIDKVGLSFGFGTWAASARRPANQVASTALAGSGQNPTGGGGPPGPGDGGPRCWVLDGCQINCLEGSKEHIKHFDQLKLGQRLVSDSVRSNVLLSTARHTVDSHADAPITDQVFLIETANGLSHPFTGTHRLRRNGEDTNGTAVVKLAKGDTLITRPDRIPEESTITKHELLIGRFEVGSVGLTPGHWFWVNRFGSHNAKMLQL